MTHGESERYNKVCQVIEGFLSNAEAAESIGVTVRHLIRLKKGVKKKGIKAVIHGNRGRRPAHAISDKLKEKILKIAYKPELKNVNFSHFKDLLEEIEGICLSIPTIGKILKSGGINSPKKRRRPKHHRSRPRKEHIGDLVLVDASPHAWLEARGPKTSLIAAIDDASGKILGAVFRCEEDSAGYFTVLEQMIAAHGIPAAIYSDRHSIFVSPNWSKLTIEEELSGKEVALTQMGRAMAELGIIHIKALSPQAKGRIERLWETLQDRLVIEMRLANVSTIGQANEFLVAYIPKFNAHFAVTPQSQEAAFRTAPGKKVFKKILCHNEIRRATSGSTISYKGVHYQLIDKKKRVVPLRPRCLVTIHELLDGTLIATYKEKSYKLKEFEILKPLQSYAPISSINQFNRKNSGKKPAADHPWRRNVRTEKKSNPIVKEVLV